MTAPIPESNDLHNNVGASAFDAEIEKEEKKRRRLLLLLMALLLVMCCAGGLFIRYILQPAPLPEVLPIPVEVAYPPRYLFSIYGVDKPVGVALSPAGDQVYVAETGGQRLVKIFDRTGSLLNSIAPPRTESGQRAPIYMATDSSGRLFVTDRTQHAVFVYDGDGVYLDTILAPDLTLSEYVSKHAGAVQPPADAIAYNQFEPVVYYQKLGEFEQTLPAPDPATWAPLGIRIDESDQILLTDVAREGYNVIRQIPADVVKATSWQEFNPPENTFGDYGQGAGQFLFPNAAVVDSQNRVYVSDGNNGRISVWDKNNQFLFHFGLGTDEAALGLPRGAAVDWRDRLYVVDAVGHDVKVFDVSGDEPVFIFVFGGLGLGDGQFNFPNDIAWDAYGRLYVADRENNRVQVWSY